MRLYEFKKQFTLDDVANFQDAFRQILGSINALAPNYSLKSDSKIVNLGICTWHPRNESSIELEKAILDDEVTLKRILAHELCHDAVYQLNLNPKLEEYLDELDAKGFDFSQKDKWVPEYNKLTEQLFDSEAGHGALWQGYAAKINAKYGADYVQEASDNIKLNRSFAQRLRQFYDAATYIYRKH